jgi:hypothetical protein
LFFLGLTAVTLLATLIPSAARWATIAGLRIPYLHWLLLGFVTLGLVSAAQERWGAAAIPGRRWLTLAVILLIISLMPLSSLWPPFLRGTWTRHFNAWASLGPALVGAGILLTAWLRRGKKIANGEEIT